MRRKALFDVANALGEKAGVWRSAADLESIAQLPDGTIEINLITHQANHTLAGQIHLEATRELLEWLHARLNALGISPQALQAAIVRAEYRTDRIPTNRSKIVSFDWICQCRLITDEREYIGRVIRRHDWHKRVAT